MLFNAPLIQVQTLPTSVIDPSPITELILANLLLTSVPKELGRLSNLELLNLNSNPLETLPMELELLTKLKTLLLCGELMYRCMVPSLFKVSFGKYDFSSH